MTTDAGMADQLWGEVGRDADAEADAHRLALATTKVAGVLPGLLGAGDEHEFDLRLRLVGERVEAAVDEVSPGDTTLLSRVCATLREDWRTHRAAQASLRATADTDSDGSVYQDNDGDWRVRGSDETYATRQDALAAADASTQGASDEEGSGKTKDGLEATDNEALPSWIEGGDGGQDDAASKGDSKKDDDSKKTSSRHAAALRLRLAEAARARTAEYYGDPHPDDYEDGFGGVGERMYDAAGAVAREHAEAGVPRTYDYPDDPAWRQGYDDAYDSAVADREHDRQVDQRLPATASLGATVACRKCRHGRAADGSGCDYCDGRGQLTAALALVKDADGWRQGLVSQGVFHPEEFGSARYEDLPAEPEDAEWSRDPWDEAAENFTPSPSVMQNHADGTELRPTKSLIEQRPGRTSARRPRTADRDDQRANPYAPANNPFGSTGPGMPGVGGPDMGGRSAVAEPPGVPDQVQEMDDTSRRAAVRRARQAFTATGGAVTALVDRMAADVMATNPGLSAVQARDLAEESVRRSVGGAKA